MSQHDGTQQMYEEDLCHIDSQGGCGEIMMSCILLAQLPIIIPIAYEYVMIIISANHLSVTHRLRLS